MKFSELKIGDEFTCIDVERQFIAKKIEEVDDYGNKWNAEEVHRDGDQYQFFYVEPHLTVTPYYLELS